MDPEYRLLVGKLVTWACDQGRGWVHLHVDGTGSVTFCYPISIKRPRRSEATR